MSALDPQWRTLAVTPIAGVDAFGSDPQGDDAFAEVESQIAKLQTAPSAVDWGRVVAEAVRVLETRAKDWRMACRLTVALYHTHGYPGLALGLGVLRDLIDECRWLHVFPPVKAKARRNYLEWLSERLVAALDQAPGPTPAAVAAVAEALANLCEIAIRAESVFGDAAPNLSPLRSRLERAHAAALALASEPVAAAVPPPADPAVPGAVQPTVHRDRAVDHAPPPVPLSPVSPAAAAPTDAAHGLPAQEGNATAHTPIVPAVPVVAGAEPTRVLRDLKRALVDLAAVLRSRRLADPRPYIMLRSALWMDLERLPPSRDGLTEVPEPVLERRRLFEQLHAQGDWGPLIEELEKTLGAGSLFWLDAHRLVAKALEALGPSHGEARQAVVQSLGFLLRRFPGLARLKFKQGSGFADALTLTWIDAEVIATAAAAALPTGEASPWLEAGTAAASLAAKGRVQEGLALFRTGMAHAGSLRERFCWELAQARACVAAGLHTVAKLQLECLESTVEQFQLEQWEPGMALEVAQLYLAVHHRVAADGQRAPEPSALHRRLLGRLCRYDVAAALTFNAQ